MIKQIQEALTKKINKEIPDILAKDLYEIIPNEVLHSNIEDILDYIEDSFLCFSIIEDYFYLKDNMIEILDGKHPYYILLSSFLKENQQQEIIIHNEEIDKKYKLLITSHLNIINFKTF